MLPEIILGLGEPLQMLQASASDGTEDKTAAFGVTDWITAIAAAVAIALSLWTHFDTRPRIKVTQSVPIVLFPADHERWPNSGRLMLYVTVVNDGSQPTQISRVLLAGNHQGLSLPVGADGPQLPYVLPGRGGQVTWMFDYEQIMRLVQSNYHDGQVSLQGLVEIGRKKHTARPVIKVAEHSPQNKFLLPPSTRMQRIVEKTISVRKTVVYRFKRWFKKPTMGSSTVFYREEDLDLSNSLALHRFKATGPWPVPSHRLIVVARVPQYEGWPGYQRMWEIPPVRVPFSWPWRTHKIWLPIIPSNHGLPPGTEFYWRCERGAWYGNQSFGALTNDKITAEKSKNNRT